MTDRLNEYPKVELSLIEQLKAMGGPIWKAILTPLPMIETGAENIPYLYVATVLPSGETVKLLICF